MKKQLLLVALTLGFVATTECKKSKDYSLAAGTSITVKSGKAPVVPAGVTVKRVSGKKRWLLTNTNPIGTPPIIVRGKRK